MCLFFSHVNSLPNDKFLDWSSFKVFADNKIDLTENFKFVLGRVYKTVGKEENAGDQHFLLFPRCFPTNCSKRLLNIVIMWERVKRDFNSET